MLKANEFEHGIGSGSRAVRRFSKEANIQYTYESTRDLLNNLDSLSAIIKHHAENQRPRLDVLDDYYSGHNTAISVHRRRKEEDKADHRARHNFAKYVSNFMQGFLVGVPIAVTSEDEQAQERIREVNETMEDEALNSDLVLDLSIYGRAYELLHRNHRDEVKSYLASPLETFLIYDNTIEQNIIAGVRYFTVGYALDQQIKVELYTEDTIYTYYTSNFGDYTLRLDNASAHPFGGVPINEYANNRFRQGDFENVLDLIDLYDSAQSDTANYMTDLNDAMLAIVGNVELGIEEAKAMKDANILLAKPGQNQEGKESNVSADYIYKKYDVNGSEAYKDRIQADIHKFTNTPDLNDAQFAGQQSGEAMKYKLFGLEQVRINKERLIKRALNRRYELVNNVMALASEAREKEFAGLTYKFTPNLPKSTKEAVEVFTDLGGELSEETKLETIPMIVEDPAAEMQRIQDERSEQRRPYMED